MPPRKRFPFPDLGIGIGLFGAWGTRRSVYLENATLV